MKINKVHATDYICGECQYRGYSCIIITADNDWRFIICAYSTNDKCFQDAVRKAREIDNFWRKSSQDKLKYFNSDESEDAYTKSRLYNEYHSKVQDEVLLAIINRSQTNTAAQSC